MCAGIIVTGDITITAACHTGDAGEQRVGDQGKAARALDLGPVELAIGCLNEAVIIAVRFAREQLDGAADGVAAGQGALRTAQYLDPVKVQQVEQVTGDGAVINVIDVDADTRFYRRVEVRLADTADERDHGAAERRTGGLQ